MKRLPLLQIGDQVSLVAPARKIAFDEISEAISIIENRGIKVVFDERLFAEHHQFSGDDNFRAKVFQDYLDNPEIKAIFFVRGGYGSLRIVDKLNFDQFQQHPKWIIGYSDSTVFHGKLQCLGYESLHASMPINFATNTIEALNSIFDVLFGKPIHYQVKPNIMNRLGEAEAEIVGGNLSVLYSLLGSNAFPETANRILFIEDLDEYLYHIDRMFLALKRAKKLEKIVGLVVGGMTEMHDNKVPFGKTAEEIIAEHTAEYDFPICYGFPVGHFDDNRAFVLGRKTTLIIKGDQVDFKFD